MSIYDTLRDDRRAVAQLLEDLGEAANEEDRCMLLEELRIEVLVQAQAEQVVLYEPLEARAEQATDVLRRQRRRQKDVEKSIEQLLSAPVNGSVFPRRLAELSDQIRAHGDAEADEVTPIAREVLGDDADDALGKRFRAEKQRLQDRGFEPVC